MTAIEASVSLSRQLNILLDAFDVVNAQEIDLERLESETFILDDVGISLSTLNLLQQQILDWLTAIQNDQPLGDATTFELNVLTEFTLHSHSLATFLQKRKMDLGEFDAFRFAQCMRDLHDVSAALE